MMNDSKNIVWVNDIFSKRKKMIRVNQFKTPFIHSLFIYNKNNINTSPLYKVIMPYTQQFFIGFGIFCLWIGVGFFTAGLFGAMMKAPDAGNARYLRCPYNCPTRVAE